MRTHSGKRPRGWTVIVLILAVVVLILFGLEYLGSEQEQKIIEQSIPIPVGNANAS